MIAKSYNPVLKSERYLVHTRESIESELKDAQSKKDETLIKECTELLATLDFYLYDDPSWTDVSGERSQSQTEEVIKPAAKCHPNL